MREVEKVSGSGSRACVTLRKKVSGSEHFLESREAVKEHFLGQGGCSGRLWKSNIWGREAVKEHFWGAGRL